MKFQLGNLSVEKGHKTTGYLDLPFTEDKLPTTLVYGQEDGETALVTGGIHNAEYVGIEGVVEMAAELKPEEVKGIVILINIVNMNGFRARTVSVSKEDGKNLNRVFPGDPNGTYTDKLARFMETELFSRANYYIDVHNGDWFEDLTPYIYCVGEAEPEVAAKAEQMAKQADMRYFIQSHSTTGAYNYAGILGIPAVLLERGGRGLWTREEVDCTKKDIRNILRYVGILTTPREEQRFVPSRMSHAHYMDSEREGCWFPYMSAGDLARKGELVGVLKDHFGNEIQKIRMREDGIILYQTISYSVPEHSPLVAYGHFGECLGEAVSEEASNVPEEEHSHVHSIEDMHENEYDLR